MTDRSKTNRGELLGVFLQPSETSITRVGSLVRDSVGTVTFLPDHGYIKLGNERPVFSLAYCSVSGEAETLRRLRDQRGKVGTIDRLPVFFQNLLPDDMPTRALKSEVAIHELDRYAMLRAAGVDLFGGIVVRDESVSSSVDGNSSGKSRSDRSPKGSTTLPSCLPGNPRKLLMNEKDGRISPPQRGETSNLIVKYPTRDLPNRPEIEFGSMTLARAAGVSTADVKLIPHHFAEGVKFEFLEFGKTLLAVSRFDRDNTRRIHAETFAQLLGSDSMSAQINYETAINLVRHVTPDPMNGVLEMIRRLVVDLMLGNRGNGLRGMSFIYRGGQIPTLSPAYNIMPSVGFKSTSTMLLPFSGKTNFSDLSIADFGRIAKLVNVVARALTNEVNLTIERASDTWPDTLKGVPWPHSLRQALSRHWKELPLLRQYSCPF